MSNVVITPKKIQGSINVSPSKVLTVRAIICAALAKGRSEIRNVRFSPNVNAAILAVEAMGAKVTKDGDCLYIDGTRTLALKDKPNIDCNAYGTILRLLLPVCAAHRGAVFRGAENFGTETVTDKILEPYRALLSNSDITFNKNGDIINVGSGDFSGRILLSSSVSSKFLSGLMMALPLLKKNSVIRLDAPFSEKDNIDITINIMQSFGIKVKNHGYRTFRIKGGQEYSPAKFNVEGDYTKAAFFLAAGAIGNFVICKGLPRETSQSDSAILDITEFFGGKIVKEKGNIAAVPSPLFGRNINISAHPDLLPIVILLGTFAEGETVITGLEAIEREYISLIAQQMNSIGATVIERQNSLVIIGSPTIAGGTADCCNDCILALTLTIASTRAKDTVTIENIDCIAKYYPEFWDDFISLGGSAN